ncbi:MAG: hypothetical protein L6R41_001846 [Letrouitia leprolyta]|nr:MAG: hypothetical protein L6R41_001846 [Letrouitia leprolyta]
MSLKEMMTQRFIDKQFIRAPPFKYPGATPLDYNSQSSMQRARGVAKNIKSVLQYPHLNARSISNLQVPSLPSLQSPTMPRPIHFLLDWDSTLTTTSTLPLIAQTGYDLHTSSGDGSLPSWTSISESYLSDYQVHRDAYSPCPAERKSIAQELAWLESLRNVERRSYERAESAGIFRSVGKDDLQRAAEDAIKEGKVVLRSGWEELVHRVLLGNGQVGIVSVGWSGEFIQGCLQAAVRISSAVQQRGIATGDVVKEIDIRANEVIGGDGKMNRYFEENGRGGPEGIWTARDKRKIMEEMIRERGRGMEEALVYVGDSTTDLECLLLADCGICIRSEGGMIGEQLELARTLARLDVDTIWIGHMKACDFEAEKGTQGTEMKGHRLWWAKGFDDIWKSPLFNNIDFCAASKLVKILREPEISSIYLCSSHTMHEALIHHS